MAPKFMSAALGGAPRSALPMPFLYLGHLLYLGHPLGAIWPGQ